MTESWIPIAIGGLLALVLGRSAVIAFLPDSEAAKFCERQLGFLDRAEAGDGSDAGDGGDGGD